MSYNPFEEKRRTDTLNRLRKENAHLLSENTLISKKLKDVEYENRLLEDAVKYLESSKPEWISVHGSMPPENSGLYFVYDGKDVGIARMSVLQFRTLTSNDVWSDITHYAPIIKPEPPKED